MGEFVERYGIFGLTMAVGLAVMIYRQSRIRTLLESWAANNGLEIVKRTSGLFRAGPFFLTLGHQVVYRLVVRDRQGNERKCWVRLGSFLMGILSDKIEVKWDQSDQFDAPGISGNFGAPFYDASAVKPSDGD